MRTKKPTPASAESVRDRGHPRRDVEGRHSSGEGLAVCRSHTRLPCAPAAPPQAFMNGLHRNVHRRVIPKSLKLSLKPPRCPPAGAAGGSLDEHRSAVKGMPDHTAESYTQYPGPKDPSTQGYCERKWTQQAGLLKPCTSRRQAAFSTGPPPASGDQLSPRRSGFAGPGPRATLTQFDIWET